MQNGLWCPNDDNAKDNQTGRKQNLWITDFYFIRLCFCTHIHLYIAYQQWVGLGSFEHLYINTVRDRRIERTMPVSAEYNCISIDIVFYRCNISGNFSLDALRDVFSKALQVFPQTRTHNITSHWHLQFGACCFFVDVKIAHFILSKQRRNFLKFSVELCFFHHNHLRNFIEKNFVSHTIDYILLSVLISDFHVH